MTAWVIHVCIGWSIAAAIIRVTVRSILLVSRHCGESRAVSCSMAGIAVVRKQPSMAHMILACTEDSACSCAVIGAVRLSPNLCQIITA